MEELANIIKEIRDIEMENNNTEKKRVKVSVVDRSNLSNEAVKRRMAEINATKKKRGEQREHEEEKEEKLKTLYEKLGTKVDELKKKVEDQKRSIEYYNKTIQLKQYKQDNLRDEEEEIKPESIEEYEQYEEQIKDIKNRISDLNEEIQLIEQRIDDIENKRFDKILAELSQENEGKPKDEEQTEGEGKPKDGEQTEGEGKPKDGEQTEGEGKPEDEGRPDGTDEQESIGRPKGSGEPEGVARLDDTGEPATPQKNSLVIYPDKVKVDGEKDIDIINVSEEDRNKINNLPKKILDKLSYVDRNNIPVDTSILLGLSDNEEAINFYLQLCILHEKETTGKTYGVPEGFPEIKYDLKKLRTNKDLSDKEKMKIYKDAKNTIRLFKDMTRRT